jgi:hypothetical protein
VNETLPCYFVRNDDVGPLTDPLKRFCELFISLGIPVCHQIVPATLTAECAAWLKKLVEAHPDLVSFGQHGLTHNMTIGNRTVWREFGPERSFAEQNAVIAAGRAILIDSLGTLDACKVFTPPQHKYDKNTLKAAREQGFEIFSAARYPGTVHSLAYAVGRALGLSSIRHHGLSQHGGMRRDVPIAELSIAIAIDDGTNISLNPNEIAPAAQEASKVTDKIGFMFHHEVYEADARYQQLEKIARSMQSSFGPAFKPMDKIPLEPHA